MSESGIEIKRVYYEGTPNAKILRSIQTTGYGTINMVEGFGFGNNSPSVSFTLTYSLYEDLLRVQPIELNDSIRKSSYSFTLVNNKLRIFPDPEEDSRMYFDYVVTNDRDNPLQTEYSGSQM